jgi:hypothetical protein
MEQCEFPVDVFMKMFGEDNLELLLTETNIHRVGEKRQMAVVTMAELKRTIGILMYMSIVSLPNIHLYWRKNMGISPVSQVYLHITVLVPAVLFDAGRKLLCLLHPEHH